MHQNPNGSCSSNETKQEDTRLLGGGKHVIKSNPARAVNEWKVDERELDGGVSSRAEGGVKGEFGRVDALDSPSFKQTADFGLPPMADDDKDNITSSRAPHVNSVHL